MIVPVTDDKRIKIVIGHGGENQVLTVDFDLTEWVEKYGLGQPYIHIKRHGDTIAYSSMLAFSDNIATWTISEIDTAKAGSGSAQLMYVVDDKIKKNKIFSIFVDRSLTSSDDIPEPYQNILDEITILVGDFYSKYDDYMALAEEKESAYRQLAQEGEENITELIEHGISLTDDGDGHVSIKIGGV